MSILGGIVVRVKKSSGGNVYAAECFNGSGVPCHVTSAVSPTDAARQLASVLKSKLEDEANPIRANSRTYWFRVG